MERIGISEAEARQTPNASIEKAFMIWSLDAARDNLKAERRRIASS